MSLITKLFGIDRALRQINENNEYFKLQYSRNNYGVYEQMGNNDDPLDYGYNVNSTIYSIVSRIYNAAAKIPFKVQEWNGEDWENVDNHPVYDLLECPNQRHGKHEFFQHVYGFKLLTGNTYLYAPIIETGQYKGQFSEMHFMPSNHVEILAGKWYDPIKGYQLSESYGSDFLAQEKVLHIRYPNFDFDNGQEFYGLSPLQVALNKLKKDKRRDELQYKNYKNAGAQGLVFDKTSDRLLKQDQQDRLQRNLNNRIKNNENSVAYIAGELGYIPLGISAADMQLIEDMKWSIKDLCNLYGLPSVLFNDSDNSKYNNMREAKASLYLNAAIPEVESFCNEFTRQWMPSFGENLRLWYDTSGIEELQKDKKELADWLNLSPQISLNEKRKMQGLEEDPELDEIGYMFPAGVAPLDQIQAANIMAAITQPNEG